MLMRFVSRDEYQIPDSFVYLCNATGFAPNNYAPVFHLGKDHIRRIIICCGAENGSADPIAIKHAVAPAQSLRQTLATRLDLDAINDFLIINSDPDRPSEWQSKGDDIKAFAQGLPIVANLQGGTTQMSLGLHNALNAAGIDWLLCTVTKPPIRTVITAVFGNEAGEKLIPWHEVKEHIPPSLLFTSRGLEPESGEIAKTRRYYADKAALADEILNRVTSDVVMRGTLYRFNQAIFNRDDDGLDEYGINLSHLRLDGEAREALPHLFNFPTFGSDVTSAGIARGLPSRFIAGGWLEQATLNALLRHFAGRRDVRFRLGVSVRKRGNSEEEGEADILVQHGDSLHVIEVKTSATAKQVRAKHRNQVANCRNLVGGEMARAWLVMPMLSDKTKVATKLRQSCALSGVSLICGDGAMEELARQVELTVNT